MAAVLRFSKQLVKSVMTFGDGWVQRLANNPGAELHGKLDNMRCNLRKSARNSTSVGGASGLSVSDREDGQGEGDAEGEYQGQGQL